jgi:rhodanese-related sulfurtransferase
MEIQALELKAKLDAGEALLLIDCREPLEHHITRIEGAELIPMNTIPAQLTRLEAAADEKALVVYCHHGMRSLQVVNWLRGQGVANCWSLAGSIDEWSSRVDPAVPRY